MLGAEVEGSQRLRCMLSQRGDEPAVVVVRELAGAMVELERVDDGPLSGETATLVVRPDPDAAECLIYDFVGPNVHLSGEAMGRFAVHLIAPRR